MKQNPSSPPEHRREAVGPRTDVHAGVTRRAALQGLATGLGAGFALPLPAEAGPDHPVRRHIAQRPAQAPAATDEPEFLDAHQLATLAVLGEIIVPGAKATASERFIDSVLAVETHETQREFLTALGAIDGFAIARHQRPFKDLEHADQVALLEEAFAQPSGRAASEPSQRGEPVTTASPAEPPTLTLRDRVDDIKGWVAGAYYSSEAGMKELGWTGNVFFREFPGCTHPDGHKSQA